MYGLETEFIRIEDQQLNLKKNIIPGLIREKEKLFSPNFKNTQTLSIKGF